MPKKRYTAEEIIHKLREAEVLLSQPKEWMYLHFHRWNDHPIHVAFQHADGVSALAVDVNNEFVKMKCAPPRRVRPPGGDAADE